MAAPARLFASTLAGDGIAAWRYRFNNLSPVEQVSAPGRGVSTGAEQRFVWGNGVGGWSAWDQALAEEMGKAWISFASDLDPNPGGGKCYSDQCP